MGKYMKKPKINRDVAVMDVSSQTLGVRTRAKTLALQSSAAAAVDFLELRSRRLEKPPIPRKSSPKKNSIEEKTQIEIQNEKSEFSASPIRNEGLVEIGDIEIEASLGENNLDLLDASPRERSTRESTPCSLIKTSEMITPPGSSTKQRTPSQRAQNELFRNIPTDCEIEEFFAEAELPLQRQFIEKYNFDIVNDVPLPGRYEWVKVMP